MAHQHQLNQFSSDGIPWDQNPNELFGFMQRNSLDASGMRRSSWHVDDASLRSLMNRAERSSLSFTELSNERLALPLFNMKQSQAPTHTPYELYHQQQFMLQDSRTSSLNSFQQVQQQQQPFQLRNSKYLKTAQEVLNEFCCLQEANNFKKMIRVNKDKLEELGDHQTSSSSVRIQSMDLLELQKIKAKLSSMLEEVDRQYRRYCEQMRNVVASFEAVAGQGSGAVYSVLASKAMSRHFRCLRDGILSQIRSVRKQMGEKGDAIAPGTTKGETPRLKLLDQSIRQQKAFQQGMMEQHPWRPQRGLPEKSVTILRSWLFEHFLHPYPNDVDKHILARETGLSRSQVSNWFINARVRLWKPMVEEMYTEETKDLEDQSQNEIPSHENMMMTKNQNPNPNPNQNPNSSSQEHLISFDDRKPLPVQLLDDSDHHFMNTLENAPKSSLHHHPQSYELLYNNNNNVNNKGSVSLTLGLQHRDGMSFSSNSNQSLLFTNDDDVDGGQQIQFSLMDGDQSHSLHYRNLMGAQLLHDSV